MIDQIQRDADQKHFEAWMDSRGNKGKYPPLEYVWHAACAYIAHCERVVDVKTAPRAIRRLRLLCAGIGTA